MNQLSNKIKIPTKTKIAGIFAAVMAAQYACIFLLMMIFDGDYTIDAALFFSTIALGYGIAAFCLLTGRKIGWYAGLIIFGATFLFFAKLAVGPNFIATDILFLSANFIAFMLLLIDRRNYLAAADNVKK